MQNHARDTGHIIISLDLTSTPSIMASSYKTDQARTQRR